jgi:hypothetical protein
MGLDCSFKVTVTAPASAGVWRTENLSSESGKTCRPASLVPFPRRQKIPQTSSTSFICFMEFLLTTTEGFSGFRKSVPTILEDFSGSLKTSATTLVLIFCHQKSLTGAFAAFSAPKNPTTRRLDAFLAPKNGSKARSRHSFSVG